MLYIYALHILLLHIFSYTVVAQDKRSHKMGSKDNSMQNKRYARTTVCFRQLLGSGCLPVSSAGLCSRMSSGGFYYRTWNGQVRDQHVPAQRRLSLEHIVTAPGPAGSHSCPENYFKCPWKLKKYSKWQQPLPCSIASDASSLECRHYSCLQREDKISNAGFEPLFMLSIWKNTFFSVQVCFSLYYRNRCAFDMHVFQHNLLTTAM